MTASDLIVASLAFRHCHNVNSWRRPVVGQFEIQAVGLLRTFLWALGSACCAAFSSAS